MKFIPTVIPDVLTIQPTVYDDERGFFYEGFNLKDFNRAIGHSVTFVQDNYSRSAKNVLRGLHYQIQHPQGKLVHVVRGTVFQVIVDLRKSSSTFCQWVGIELSEVNPVFPHHPTADQFFSETQFEAYRSLGEHIGDKLFLRTLVGEHISGSDAINIEEWFKELGKRILEAVAI